MYHDILPPFKIILTRIRLDSRLEGVEASMDARVLPFKR